MLKIFHFLLNNQYFLKLLLSKDKRNMLKVSSGDFLNCFKYIVWDNKKEKLIPIS